MSSLETKCLASEIYLASKINYTYHLEKKKLTVKIEKIDLMRKPK